MKKKTASTENPFVKRSKKNADFLRGLANASAKLKLWARLVSLLTPAAHAKYQSEMAAITREMATENRKADDAWSAEFGADAPIDIEQIERLCARAGYSPERIEAGDFALNDVLPVIEGYLQRVRDNEFAAKVAAIPPSKHEREMLSDPLTRNDVTYVFGVGYRKCLEKPEDYCNIRKTAHGVYKIDMDLLLPMKNAVRRYGHLSTKAEKK